MSIKTKLGLVALLAFYSFMGCDSQTYKNLNETAISLFENPPGWETMVEDKYLDNSSKNTSSRNNSIDNKVNDRQIPVKKRRITKDKYQENNLIQNNSKKSNQKEDNNPIERDLLKGEKINHYNYIIDGEKSTIDLKVFKSINDSTDTFSAYLFSDIIGYTSNYPNSFQVPVKKHQKKAIKPLVDKIKSKTSNKEKQAKIAISLVQNIEYKEGDLKDPKSDKDNFVKFPYEVLYHNKGDCDEKSVLLADILDELGFGTAFLYYKEKKHIALGIKTDSKYDFNNSGYAFVETTNPFMITYSNSLKQPSQIIKYSEGLALNDLHEETKDAKKIKQIHEEIDSTELKILNNKIQEINNLQIQAENIYNQSKSEDLNQRDVNRTNSQLNKIYNKIENIESTIPEGKVEFYKDLIEDQDKIMEKYGMKDTNIPY